jgi:hypothetical protein
MNITDYSLIEISNYCFNLKILILKNCSEITDSGLMEVAKKCLKLENIDLSHNQINVTDRSLMAISDNCLNLKKLNRASCKKTADNK